VQHPSSTTFAGGQRKQWRGYLPGLGHSDHQEVARYLASGPSRASPLQVPLTLGADVLGTEVLVLGVPLLWTATKSTGAVGWSGRTMLPSILFCCLGGTTLLRPSNKPDQAGYG
jgi:hypothetical protein